MKILHITNYYHEGFGYQENYLPAGQKKLGCDVVILASDYYAQFPSYDTTMIKVLGERCVGVGEYVDNGVTVIRERSHFSHSRPGFILFNVGKVLKRYNPDIVHVHGATNIWLFQLLYFKARYGFKIFVDSHQDYSVENYDSPIFGSIYYSLWRWFHQYFSKTNMVEKYLAITKQAGEWLQHRLGVSIECQLISPLGVDLDSMRYSESADKAYKEKWDANGKYVLVNAGKQYDKKNILWIIELAKILIDMEVNIFLVLVGDADHAYDGKIKSSLMSLPIGAWIRYPFLARNELSKIYSASDVGIWPGIPSNTIQEAMSCGVVLALPDNDIVGHLIDGNGIHIDDDVRLTAIKLSRILQSKEMFKQMKARSIQIASTYSWDNISKRTIEAYQSEV